MSEFQLRTLLVHRLYEYAHPFLYEIFQPFLQYEQDEYDRLKLVFLVSFSRFHDELGQNHLIPPLLVFHR